MGRALRTLALRINQMMHFAPPVLRAFTAQTVLDSLRDAVHPLAFSQILIFTKQTLSR